MELVTAITITISNFVPSCFPFYLLEHKRDEEEIDSLYDKCHGETNAIQIIILFCKNK